MANNLTNALAVLTQAARIVPRESVGVIQSMNLAASNTPIGLGQSARVPIVPSKTAGTFTPTIDPDDIDTTVSAKTLTLDQSAEVGFDWSLEDERALNNGDAGAQDYLLQSTQQAIRACLANAEAYFHGIAYKGASRAHGTAGTAPMGTNLNDAAAISRILDENGVSPSDRSLVLNHASIENIRKQVNLGNVSSVPGGIADRLNVGSLGNFFGLDVRASNYLTTHTAGTGADYLVNKTAGIAIGDLTVPADTGSGTLLVGDVVQIGTGGLKYVVGTALSGGSFGINAPGVFAAAADDTPITRAVNYVPNLAIHRGAVAGVMRPALVDAQGMVVSSQVISDPISGISFTAAMIGGYGKRQLRISCVYAGVVVNSEAIAVLLG